MSPQFPYYPQYFPEENPIQAVGCSLDITKWIFMMFNSAGSWAAANQNDTLLQTEYLCPPKF